MGRDEKVEISFLESVRNRCPRNQLLLEALGELYTGASRYEDGLRVDEELIKVCPKEPVAWYNLGCSYALVGRKDEAFTALSRAVELGYSDRDWMLRDGDLETLRNDPRFFKLVNHTRS